MIEGVADPVGKGYREIMQDLLYGDPDLATFYDSENGWRDDTRCCRAFAEQAASVLDLGCGTGLLAAALGPGRDVWGVDPAGAMLDIARRRPGGTTVTWVEADARSVRLGRQFDLVVLTGHAFQCFLTDGDQRSLCETIAAHLAPGGTFIFDSRNPAREEWQEWLPELSGREFDHPVLGRIRAWNDVRMDDASGIVTYDSFYADSIGSIRKASSRIRFATHEDIAARIAEAGLSVERWLGSWTGEPMTESSPEIIAIGTLA